MKISSSVAIRIRICIDPHDFGLLDPHPKSAFQMRIPDADPDPATKFELLIRSSASCDKKNKFFKNFFLLFKNRFTLKGQSSKHLVQCFDIYGES
jgi:hypothetical protein